MLARRMSEYSECQLGRGGYGSAENRKLENVKRAIWQSSLGFGGLSDISQSRRHSFADVPTRHASVGSAEKMGARENGHQDQILRQDVQSRLADSNDFSINDHGKLAPSTIAQPFLSPGVNYSREAKQQHLISAAPPSKVEIPRRMDCNPINRRPPISLTLLPRPMAVRSQPLVIATSTVCPSHARISYCMSCSSSV